MGGLFWFIVIVIYLSYVGARASSMQRQQAERRRRLAEARAQQREQGGTAWPDAGQQTRPPAEPRRSPRPLQPGPVMGPRPRMETVPPPPRPQSAAPSEMQARRPVASSPATAVTGPTAAPVAGPMMSEYGPASAAAPAPAATGVSGPSGLPAAMARLTPWQQAVVMSEVLGRPRALRPWRRAGHNRY